MKAALMSALLSAALAFSASADDVRLLPDQSGADTRLSEQGNRYEKARKLMKEEMQKPSWGWYDDNDCGSFPEDELALLNQHSSRT